MSEPVQHTHAIYFGEQLNEIWDRRVALSGFVQDLNKYHFGKATFTQHGDAETPDQQPVITGCFLPAELMKATGRGLVFKVIKGIERRELSL